MKFGKDLRINQKPIKKNAFVVIRSDFPNSSSCKKNMDIDIGNYPKWDQKLVMGHAMCKTVPPSPNISDGFGITHASG